MNKWHAMATAPNDGTHVLVWDGDMQRMAYQLNHVWYGVETNEPLLGDDDLTAWQHLPEPPP